MSRALFAEDQDNFIGSPLVPRRERHKYYSLSFLNLGGINLQNFETRPQPHKPTLHQQVAPLHVFEAVLDNMAIHNTNTLAVADLKVPKQFQEMFNRHRNMTLTVASNEAEPAATTGIFSAKSHAALTGTSIDLGGRCTIHTYSVGKKKRPHGLRRVSVACLYVPQRNAATDP